MNDPRPHDDRAHADEAALAGLPAPPLPVALARRVRARGLRMFARAHAGRGRVLAFGLGEALVTSALAGVSAVYLAWAVEAAARVLPP